MNNDEPLLTILNIIDKMPKSNFGLDNDGWVNLAQLGGRLKNAGIDFKTLGFNRLRDFIASLNTKLDVKNFIPEGKNASVAYVRKIQPIQPIEAEQQRNKSFNIALFEWAYMGDFEKVLIKLCKIALNEKWDFSNSSMVKPYPILRNYFIYTFERLQAENKILISDRNQYAVFNTGLVNQLYSPIFALFTKNTIPNKQMWHFVDFAVEGEDKAGKMLVKEFRELPQAPEYFKNISDAFYDVSMGKPVLDTTHILIERAERMPIQFLKTFGPNKFEFKDYQLLSKEERIQYANQLKRLIESDVDAQRRMQNRIEAAVNLAIKRVQWNYKSAIPMYYPRRKKMCLLLPLCLVDEQVVDTALVVSKEPSGRYQGQTIYLLDWAYKCARLVCRPDSDWLTVEYITNAQDDIE